MTALRALAAAVLAAGLSTPAHALDVTPALAGLCEVSDAGDALLEQRLAAQADDADGQTELETQLADMVTRHVTGHTVVAALRLQAHCQTLLEQCVAGIGDLAQAGQRRCHVQRVRRRRQQACGQGGRQRAQCGHAPPP